MVNTNYITGEKDYLTEDSVIIRLALKEGEFTGPGEKKKSPLTQDLEGKLLDDERLKERKRTAARQQGYRKIVDDYCRHLSDRMTEEGNKIARIDYKKLWTEAPKKYGIKMKFGHLVKKHFFSRKKEIETSKIINPSSLEEIAEERRQGNLRRYDLFTHTKVGMYGALIDLSFQALQNPSLTAEEGEFLIKNAYLALYASRDELPEELYQRFIQIELFQQHNGLPEVKEHVRKAVSKASRAIRSKYPMDYTRRIKHTRTSKEVEKALLQREVEQELKRIEEESTDESMEFPESW